MKHVWRIILLYYALSLLLIIVCCALLLSDLAAFLSAGEFQVFKELNFAKLKSDTDISEAVKYAEHLYGSVMGMLDGATRSHSLVYMALTVSAINFILLLPLHWLLGHLPKTVRVSALLTSVFAVAFALALRSFVHGTHAYNRAYSLYYIVFQPWSEPAVKGAAFLLLPASVLKGMSLLMSKDETREQDNAQEYPDEQAD